MGRCVVKAPGQSFKTSEVANRSWNREGMDCCVKEVLGQSFRTATAANLLAGQYESQRSHGTVKVARRVTEQDCCVADAPGQSSERREASNGS